MKLIYYFIKVFKKVNDASKKLVHSIKYIINISYNMAHTMYNINLQSRMSGLSYVEGN